MPKTESTSFPQRVPLTNFPILSHIGLTSEESSQSISVLKGTTKICTSNSHNMHLFHIFTFVCCWPYPALYLPAWGLGRDCDSVVGVVDICYLTCLATSFPWGIQFHLPCPPNQGGEGGWGRHSSSFLLALGMALKISSMQRPHHHIHRDWPEDRYLTPTVWYSLCLPFIPWVAQENDFSYTEFLDVSLEGSRSPLFPHVHIQENQRQGDKGWSIWAPYSSSLRLLRY